MNSYEGFRWPDSTTLGDAGFAQNTSVIPDTEALKHIGQSVTVEGTVAKVFTSKNGNTFLIFGGDIIHL